MAKFGKITVPVGLEIPQETAERCLRILEMWMNDNPCMSIQCDEIATGDGISRRLLFVQTREEAE